MRPGAGRWPSLGCLAVCATYALVLAFFVWGLSTPDLDRVWTLHHELKIGRMAKLHRSDRALLEECMARYGKLAGDLLDGADIGIVSANSDGWIATPTATVLRTGKSAKVRKLVVDVQTPDDLMPYRLVVRGRGWKKKVEVTAHGRLEVELPAPPPAPEVVEVRMRGRKFAPDPSVLGVRLTFGESP